MEIYKLKDMKANWYAGAFQPTAFYTGDFEVAYSNHSKGQKWPVHKHKIATEINLLVKGRMIVQGKTLRKGDIFILFPNEIADPVFLTNCSVVVIKAPSIKGDKYLV